MLTPEQRAELEEHGAASIRFKLTQYGAGRGASISGFKCGDITRGDIEDWLARKSREEAAQARCQEMLAPPCDMDTTWKLMGASWRL